jgi:hypothetical protein
MELLIRLKSSERKKQADASMATIICSPVGRYEDLRNLSES